MSEPLEAWKAFVGAVGQIEITWRSGPFRLIRHKRTETFNANHEAYPLAMTAFYAAWYSRSHELPSSQPEESR